MPESEKHTSAAIFFTHSLTLSRSLSVPLSLFSHIFRQLHIRCSLCQLGGASLTRFFYQLALSFKLIIKQHPNIKINTIFKKFIRIRLCYFFFAFESFLPFILSFKEWVRLLFSLIHCAVFTCSTIVLSENSHSNRLVVMCRLTMCWIREYQKFDDCSSFVVCI